MPIRITISQSTAETINYTSKKDGSPQMLRKQTAYAHVVNETNEPALYPEKFGFLLNREQAPFAAGEYTLHPSAIAVRDGQLVLSSNRLTPVKVKAAV